MISKLLLSILFIVVFFYAAIRPFKSVFSKLFFMFGSFLGFLSMIDQEISSNIAIFLGISRVSDLYLYIGLITTFFFIGLSLNKFRENELKTNELARKIAILEAKQKY